MNNPCTRCQKERVDLPKIKVILQTFIGPQTVYNIQSVCPDPECQKIVDQKLAILKDKLDDILLESNKRAQERKTNNAKLKAASAALKSR